LAADDLTGGKYIKIDKRALMAFLKEGLGDTLVQGKSVNLDSSQELTRMIPIICAYFSQHELTQLVGRKTAKKILELQRTEMLQNLFLERELQNVLRTFKEAGIRLLLFKGPALAYTVYPQPHLRTYHDIDALIHPDDLSRAHDVLTQVGYTFYEEFETNAVDSERSGYNYILKRADSWLEVLIELHTAFHASEIGTIFNVEALWERAQAISVLGEPTLTLGTVDHLLYLCWHYRFHGFTRLLWLYDLVVMLRATGTQLDWNEVVRTAQEQHLVATLYYCLSWCRDLFDVAIPAEIHAKLRPPLLSRVIVERIAMPHVLKALTAAPLLPRRMVARRAMSDSQAELIQAGLRMLFPTPAALVRRYMSHSRWPLQLFFVFYLIHPWVTLVKGCRDLMKRGRG
jgi:Uncharacterised nucleotidyltransferase